MNIKIKKGVRYSRSLRCEIIEFAQSVYFAKIMEAIV